MVRGGLGGFWGVSSIVSQNLPLLSQKIGVGVFSEYNLWFKIESSSTPCYLSMVCRYLEVGRELHI